MAITSEKLDRNTWPKAMARAGDIALRTLLTGAGLAFAFWKVDPARLGLALSGVSVTKLVLALAFSLSIYLTQGLRLRLLSGASLSLARGVAASILCMGINCLLPAKLGEAAKVLYLGRNGRLGTGTSLALVFWERFGDLNAMALLGLAALPFLGHGPETFLLPGIVGLLWLAVFLVRRRPAPITSLLGKIPMAMLRRPLLDALDRLCQSNGPRFYFELTLSTMLTVLASYTMTYALVAGVAGIPVTPQELLVVFVISSLGSAVPAAPAGLGVYEASMILSLGWFGAAPEQALTAALALRAVLHIPAIMAALVLAARSGLRLRGLGSDVNGAGQD